MHDGVNLRSSCDAIHAFIREITLTTIVAIYIPYSGFFPEVLIFPNFPNELLAREILFWTADCFKRVYCVITKKLIVSNTCIAS